MEEQSRKGGQVLNKDERKFLQDYIAARPDPNVPFTRREIRPLIPKLKELSDDGHERSVGSVYMWLRKLSGKVPTLAPEKKLVGMDRIMEKVGAHLKRMERCIKKEFCHQLSVERERVNEEKKKREIAEKERKIYKERVQHVEQELKRLKVIREAVETVQQQELGRRRAHLRVIHSK